ncbi:uncharacterized protein LOC119681210 [Teleopsis dalmanni]|uniref:uncharacterized protein LOC119681210 n=1 Tax=Teleopsis dalmanni TaxID=139649 RepID=UPI0018CE9E57|nr:uncharacterized protein LOC119681210 [Teleopsis dalmanni]
MRLTEPNNKTFFQDLKIRRNIIMGRFRRFMNKNAIAVVMIPSIILLHYGWSVMQNNRSLVSEDEQIDLPVVTFAKYCWKRITDLQPNIVSKQVENKPINSTTQDPK